MHSTLFVFLNVAGGVLGIALLVRAHRHTRGTTFTAPVLWAILAMGALVSGEIYLAPRTAADAPVALLRYLFSVGTLTPVMAVLGAKRPQHRGWQFIVLSLWIVSTLPAMQAWISGTATSFALPTAWQWFLALIIATGLVNYLPTRHALAAFLAAVAQGTLWAIWSGYIPQESQAAYVTAAVWLFDFAIILASIHKRRAAALQDRWSRSWIDFRDTYGAVWGLRVMERINQAGASFGWPWRLRWHGLVPPFGTPADPDCERTSASAELDQTYRTVLRRFVDDAWLTRRELPSRRT